MADKEQVKKYIVEYIEKDGRETFTDIANWLSLWYNLSEGSAKNYLNELVEEKKIRTWYEGGRRYYDAPIDKEAIIPGLIAAIEKSYLFKSPMTMQNINNFLKEYGITGDEAGEIVLSLQHEGVIRSYKKNGVLYFTPQRIPLSIKVFLFTSAVIATISLFFGAYLELSIQLALPLSFLATIITCGIWYCQEKKILFYGER